MRFILVCMILLFPLIGMAQTPEERIRQAEVAAKEVRETALMRWRAQKVPENSSLQPGTDLYREYLEVFKREYEKYRKDFLRAREEICKTPNVTCRDEDLREFNSGVNIAVALVTARDQWARDNVPADQQSGREEALRDCVKGGENCQNLPATDRSIATVAQTPSTVTSTDVSSADAEMNEFARSLEAKLQEKKNALEASNPGWENAPMSADIASLHLDLIKFKQDEMMKKMNELCEKYKENRFCSEEKKTELTDHYNGQSCLIQRRAQVQTLNTDKDKLNQNVIQKHKDEWALLNPKVCETLLRKDRDSLSAPVTTPPPQVTQETPGGEDQQSPGNYDASTCEWSSDMPRRIVNGPGCANNSRTRMCTGWVICKQKNSEAKFVRMSTCHPRFCQAGKEMAVKCTKDLRYFSTKPSDEEKIFATPRVRRVLKSSTSEQ